MILKTTHKNKFVELKHGKGRKYPYIDITDIDDRRPQLNHTLRISYKKDGDFDYKVGLKVRVLQILKHTHMLNVFKDKKWDDKARDFVEECFK